MNIASVSPSAAIALAQPVQQTFAVIAAAEAQQVQMLTVLASGGQSGIAAALGLGTVLDVTA